MGAVGIAWWLLLGVGLFATSPILWPGLLGGAFLFWLVFRSHYRDGLVWFSSLPGLYHFWGVEATQEAISQAFFRWGITAGVLVLLALAASSLLNHWRWAILWGLPLVFLRPEGWTLGLLALAHGVAVLERERNKASDLGRRFLAGSSAIWASAAILLALALVVGPLALPKFQQAEITQAQSANTTSPTPTPPQTQPTTPSQPRTAVVQHAADTPFARFALAGTDLLFNLSLLLLLLITSLVVFAMMRERRRASRLDRRWLLMIGLVIFGWGMALMWYLVNQKGSSGGGSGGVGDKLGATPESGTPVNIQIVTTNQDGLFAISLLIALVAAVLLGAVLFFLLRNLPILNPLDEPASPSPVYRVGGWQAGPPEHRIRRAYYDFLHRMELQGFGRMNFESAREYARRLAQMKPFVQGYLLELVTLYEPVRYGGNRSEAQAERAEFLAAQIPPHYEEKTA